MNIFKKLFLWLTSIKNLFVQSRNKKKETQKKIDYDDEAHESWETNFCIKDSDIRFAKEEGDGYRAFFGCFNNKDGFFLELQRKNLYAWVENKFFRYKDFVLEAVIELIELPNTKNKKSDIKVISQKNCNKNIEMAGSYSFGFIFRNIGKAFYSILISDKGMARLDVVINNMPKTLCPWILLDELSKEVKLTIVALGSSITLLVNNKWIAKIEDDSIDAAGKIAFAMQNYRDFACVSTVLKKIAIDSRTIEVQKKYDLVNTEANITKKSRARLCKAYYAVGNFSCAMSEIKKIEKMDMEVEDYLVAGDICSAVNITEKAETYFLDAIEIQQKLSKETPKNEKNCPYEKEDRVYMEAFVKLAYLYSNTLQYQKLKNLLEKIGDEKIENSSILCSIKAHYLSHEGHYTKAAEFYKKASKLNPKDTSSLLMAASSYSLAGNKDDAIIFYMKVANLFLEQGSYIEFGKVLTSLEHLGIEDERYMTLNAKFYYGTNQKDKAYEICKNIISHYEVGADIWYLYGILLQERGEKGAQDAFMIAYKKDQTNSSYAYALGKSLYLEQKECEVYIIEALKGEKIRGEAYNLYATLMIDKKNLKRAEEYVEKAKEFLPCNLDVFQNYLHIKRLRGKLKETYHLFGLESPYILDMAVEYDRGRAWHIFAKELDLDGEFQLAYEMYHNALKLQKKDDLLYYDAAKNALTLGYLAEANDMTIKAIEIRELADYYILLAKIAKEMGQHTRCSAIIGEGFNKKIFDEYSVLELIYLYLSINKKEEARRLMQNFKAMPNAKVVLSLDKKKELENIIGNF